MQGSSLTLADGARRMALKPGKKGWKTKAEMRHVGGSPGKLHREIGVPKGEKIPAAKLEAAEHSRNPEVRRDAIRAKTMEGWHHGGRAAKRYPSLKGK